MEPMPTTEPLPPTEPNYDAMARAWQEEGLGENPLPPPRMEPPRPPPPEPLAFAAANVKVQFFGVAPNDAYLKPMGIGIGRGPTGKAEYTFSELFSLNITSLNITTLRSFADYILKMRLSMSAGDLCSQNVKVLKLDGFAEHAAPFEMLGLDTPVTIEHQPEGTVATHKIILYLRAEPLRINRAAVGLSKWLAFKEALVEHGLALSGAKLAALVGHGEGTIKSALSNNSPSNGNVCATILTVQPNCSSPSCDVCVCATQALFAIEKFMCTHFDSNFKELPVALAKLELKSGKRPVGEAVTEEKPKRARTFLTRNVKVYVDAYLEQYINESGSKAGRATLFEFILKGATASGVQGSDDLTIKIISDRLHNALTKKNAATKKAAAMAQQPEVQEVGTLPAE